MAGSVTSAVAPLSTPDPMLNTPDLSPYPKSLGLWLGNTMPPTVLSIA